MSDGAGRLFEARIEAVRASEVEAVIISTVNVPRPAPRVSVVQGVAKGAKMDWVVTKLVELGVDEIVVFHAGRSIPRWDDSRRAQAAERYTTLAYAAAKQSRRAFLPEVVGPLEMPAVLEVCARRRICLVADPDAELALRQGLPLEPVPDLTLVVGPEGGLGPEEVNDFIAIGASPVRLGSQILRTETAGLVLASVAMFHVGRLE